MKKRDRRCWWFFRKHVAPSDAPTYTSFTGEKFQDFICMRCLNKVMRGLDDTGPM